MDFDQMNRLSSDDFDDATSVREVFEKYIIHLKWFILSILLFVVLAFFKLRYEVPQYNVNASILIKEKEKGNSINSLAAFEDLGLFGSGDNSLENEIQILQSRRLMSKVVEELKLNIRYFIVESPYDKEQYPNFPVILHFKDSIPGNDLSSSFEIYLRNKSEFELFGADGFSFGIKKIGKDFKFNFGDEEKVDIHMLNIEFNEYFDKNFIGKKIRINIYPINVTVNNYMQGLTIEPVNEKLSKVLTLSLNESNINRGKAIINNLIEQFNADGIQDKNDISKASTDFLNERIALISTEISAIENTAAQFKTKNRMVDATTDAGIFMQSSSNNESDLVAANTQKELISFMFDKLNNSASGELLPGNIGLSDPSILNMVGEYNNLILQRNRILKSSSTKNPIIINIDSQLSVLKNNLKSSLNNLNSTLLIQIAALSKQNSRINYKIASVPKNEREFKDIVRQQETKNTLYLFLLQKREESILSNAIAVEKAKIIDTAYSDGKKVSPKKMITFLGAIILGVLIPFIIIYIKDLLDTKIHDENDIKQLKIPYLGDVPLGTTKNDLYISDIDDSNIAEAFRYIRTNINFMLDRKELGKTVFVTSTQGGEGKTFTAINLAFSLAISGKKTLLLGMDLRAPKISKYLELKNLKGVTNFIKNNELEVDEIIEKRTKFENFHLINSGDIPPNPVELLMSKRVDELFAYAKEHYEFIIVDSAPVGMVTDTIQIGKYADMTIYILKANFLDKRMLHIPDKLHKENKLPNMAILINGTDHSKGAYGYGYGYGKKRKKPWYKKFF